jgi:hypothetical protein
MTRGVLCLTPGFSQFTDHSKLINRNTNNLLASLLVFTHCITSPLKFLIVLCGTPTYTWLFREMTPSNGNKPTLNTVKFYRSSVTGWRFLRYDIKYAEYLQILYWKNCFHLHGKNSVGRRDSTGKVSNEKGKQEIPMWIPRISENENRKENFQDHDKNK